MARSVEALVNPRLLSWARKTAGLDLGAAAQKARVGEEALDSWERGQSRPSVSQLRRLGKVYRRPIAVFYLPEPPQGFTVPKDYRRPDASFPQAGSPGLLFEVRQAHSRREVLTEILESIDEAPSPVRISATTAEAPENVAEGISAFLGLSMEDRVVWKSPYDTLNGWRAAFERAGILVFQMYDVPWEEARGFSLHAEILPVVVVNAKDAPNGRTFTMLHEIAHLALRDGGICDLSQHDPASGATNQIEAFCNAVAAEVLMPRLEFTQDPMVVSNGSGQQWTAADISALTNKFHCSRDVALRRLLDFNFISMESYRWMRSQFAVAGRPSGQGFPQPAQTVVSKLGRLYVNSLLTGFYQDYITGSDLADLLEVRLKHLPRIEAILSKSSS